MDTDAVELNPTSVGADGAALDGTAVLAADDDALSVDTVDVDELPLEAELCGSVVGVPLLLSGCRSVDAEVEGLDAVDGSSVVVDLDPSVDDTAVALVVTAATVLAAAVEDGAWLVLSVFSGDAEEAAVASWVLLDVWGFAVLGAVGVDGCDSRTVDAEVTAGFSDVDSAVEVDGFSVVAAGEVEDCTASVVRWEVGTDEDEVGKASVEVAWEAEAATVIVEDSAEDVVSSSEVVVAGSVDSFTGSEDGCTGDADEPAVDGRSVEVATEEEPMATGVDGTADGVVASGVDSEPEVVVGCLLVTGAAEDDTISAVVDGTPVDFVEGTLDDDVAASDEVDCAAAVVDSDWLEEDVLGPSGVVGFLVEATVEDSVGAVTISADEVED